MRQAYDNVRRVKIPINLKNCHKRQQTTGGAKVEVQRKMTEIFETERWPGTLLFSILMELGVRKVRDDRNANYSTH